jgi:hypothetical protein
MNQLSDKQLEHITDLAVQDVHDQSHWIVEWREHEVLHILDERVMKEFHREMCRLALLN